MRYVLFALLLLHTALVSAEFPAWAPLSDTAILSVASAGRDAGVLIARRVGLDPVRSTDGGRTWTAFTVRGTRPDRFVGSPTDALSFYAMAGGITVDFGPSIAPASLYRTRDGGLSWELVAATLTTAAGSPLGDVVVGAHPELLYAGRVVGTSCFGGNCLYTGHELFSSSDGGRSWRSVDLPVGGTTKLAFPSPSDTRVIYAATADSLYRSDDQGSHWRLLRGKPESDYNAIAGRPVQVDCCNPDIQYFAPTNDTDILVTEDGGNTYRLADPGAVPGPGHTLLADPVTTGRVFYLGDEGEIVESRDRGRTWQRVAPGAGVVNLIGRSGLPRDTRPVVIAEGERRVFVVPRQGASWRIELGPRALALGSDLWWNPAESGLGFSITQHASGQVFAGWYAYDADGRPSWRFVSGGSWTDDRTFTGGLNEANGPAFFPGPFTASNVSARTIGTATFHFDDDSNATFSYRLDSGEAGEKRISRLLFGPRIPDALGIFSNYSDTWWNPAESGWGVAIAHQHLKVFAIWYVYDDAGRPTWVVMPDANVSGYVTGTGPVLPAYGGDLFALRGPPAGQPYDPARLVPTRIGTAKLIFSSRSSARIDWTAFGSSGSRPLERLPF
jgi:photosystem II stability/assembly factor-like uncharacterized protein